MLSTAYIYNIFIHVTSSNTETHLLSKHIAFSRRLRGRDDVLTLLYCVIHKNEMKLLQDVLFKIQKSDKLYKHFIFVGSWWLLYCVIVPSFPRCTLAWPSSCVRPSLSVRRGIRLSEDTQIRETDRETRRLTFSVTKDPDQAKERKIFCQRLRE